ncbi:uncharacterized protein LOC144605885 isoform X2 [Rhinoraja longicauda]
MPGLAARCHGAVRTRTKKRTKRQKCDSKNLQRLENQKVTRLRQLKEERRHFALVMRRRLAPSRPNTNRPSQTSPWATRPGINLPPPTGANGRGSQPPIQCLPQGRAVTHPQPRLPQVSSNDFSELAARNTCTVPARSLRGEHALSPITCHPQALKVNINQ